MVTQAHTEARASVTCEQVQNHLAGLAEGALLPELTFSLMTHVHGCAECTHELKAFRQFISVEVPQAVLEAVRQAETPAAPAPVARKSPFWQQWQERMEQWLDTVFPATLQPAYRGGSVSGAAWELNARKHAQQPFLDARLEGTEVVAHVARGLMFGRVGGHEGEPRYPVLLELQGGSSQQRVLNHPDGTFLLRWDPDATELRCKSPAGGLSCFALPS